MKILSNKKYNDLISKQFRGIFADVNDDNLLRENGLLYGENKELQKEIDRLNNIINDLLKRQNEALNYISNFLSMDNRYKHGNGNDELELVRRILNKHNQEPKGSDSNGQ